MTTAPFPGTRGSGLIPSRAVAGVPPLTSSVLGLEQLAGNPRAAYDHASRHVLGLEFHGVASVGKTLIPRHIIVHASMAVDMLTHAVPT